MPDRQFPERVEEIRAAMKAYAGGEDTPPMRICKALLAVCADLSEKMDALKAQPVADVERQVTKMLNTIRPAFELKWKWHRWAMVAGSATVALALSCAAAAFVAYTIGRGMGVAEAERWSAYCAQHVVVQGGETFCKVPVQAPRAPG